MPHRRGCRPQQRGHDRADLAVVIDVLASLFEEEESGFDIHSTGLVEDLFAHLGHRFLHHHTDSVDRDVGPPDGSGRIHEQLFHCAGRGQVRLKGHRFGAYGFDRRNGVVGSRFSGIAVIVDGDGFRAGFGEFACQEPTKVLRATGEQSAWIEFNK